MGSLVQLVSLSGARYGWTIQEAGEAGEGARFVITIAKLNDREKENYRIVQTREYMKTRDSLVTRITHVMLYLALHLMMIVTVKTTTPEKTTNGPVSKFK